MKKQIRLLIALAAIFTLVSVIPANGQAPPPPAHGQNGNQLSPGGTGCPLDRTNGIAMMMVIALGYAGFALIQRGKNKLQIS
jgi:hypothetical protein